MTIEELESVFVSEARQGGSDIEWYEPKDYLWANSLATSEHTTRAGIDNKNDLNGLDLMYMSI